MRVSSLFLLVAVAACRAKAGADPAAGQGQPGRLEVRWYATTVGTPWTGVTEARWCAADSALLIFTMRNDTAVGLALYAPDSLKPERYPVFPPAPFQPRRPQATVAVRQLTEAGLKTFESMSGELTVTAAGGERVSGSFDVRVRQSNTADQLHLTGGFNVAILPAESPCGRANKPVIR